MKKFFAAVIAATMLTAPVASVQAAPAMSVLKNESSVQQVQYRQDNRRDVRRNDRRDVKRYEQRAPVVKKYQKKRWERGNRVPSWQRYSAVDYKRYHLRQPPKGHRWVKVDNDYLLIAVGTGLIASIIAGR